MEIRIPAPAEEIIRKLNEQGYEAYVVGGCVRDMLLHRQPEDWDITTSALPRQVKAVFGRTVDTGIQHGTVTVMMGKEGYEVTTYRIDGEYSDGRHPNSVSFTPSLLEDLKRRDFTINAMAYNSRTGFVDAFGGTEDLRKGMIRCVGDPMDRFTEDALRILRAIRFSAQLGFAIEEKTYEAIRIIAPNMVHVSKERIQTELTKLLLSGHPEQIKLVYETGISPYVSAAFHQVVPPAVPVSVPAKKHLRWAAFLRTSGQEAAVRILRDLKLDNDTIYKTRTLVEWLNRPVAEMKKETPDVKTAIRRAMSIMGPELFDDLLTVKLCFARAAAKGVSLLPGDCPEPLEALEAMAAFKEEILQNGDCISLKTLAVTGRDVMEAGVKPGKEVGAILAGLLELVLEEPEKNRKEYLLSHIYPETHCNMEENPL